MIKLIKRNLKLSDHNISKARYHELKYFCMQYEEKKRELGNGYGLGAMNYDGMPKGSDVGCPTESKAIRNDILKRDTELIEQTAIEADAELYQYIIKSVAEGIPYEYMDAPCGRRQFYESRRYFFFLLDKKR